MRSAWLSASVCLLMLFGCRTQLIVTRAELQPWAGGAAGSGGGKGYTIWVSRNHKGMLQADSVWAGDATEGKLFQPTVLTGENTMDREGKIPEDSLTFRLVFSERHAGEGGRQGKTGQDEFPMKQPAPEWIPKSFSGAAVILFHDAGKKYLLEVKEFNRLPRLNYP